MEPGMPHGLLAKVTARTVESHGLPNARKPPDPHEPSLRGPIVMGADNENHVEIVDLPVIRVGS